MNSGAVVLDDWLRRQAGQSRRADTAATWVIADDEYRVVAYVAMSMGAVDTSYAPTKLTTRGLRQIPVLLCGRLAVDQEYRRLGLGTVLVELLLRKAIAANDEIACRAVVVNALDAEARAWWERFGFVPFTDSPDERDLYLLTGDIELTLSEPLTPR